MQQISLSTIHTNFIPVQGIKKQVVDIWVRTSLKYYFSASHVTSNINIGLVSLVSGHTHCDTPFSTE